MTSNLSVLFGLSVTRFYRPVVSVIFALVIVASGFAQNGPSITVDAGKAGEIRLPFAFNRENLRVELNPVDLATVKLNVDEGFRVTGQTPGEGTIMVTGTRDAIDAAGRNKKIPFRYVLSVRVLPRLDVDTKTRELSVDKLPGEPLTIDVGYLMQPGQQFYRLNKKGITWQALFLVGGNSSIARGEVYVDDNENKLRITGIADGKTTFRLLGERRVGNTWQKVERVLPVTVGTGRPGGAIDGNSGRPGRAIQPTDTAAAAVDGREKIVDSIERNYATTKDQVDAENYDDTEAGRLLKDLESLVALIDERISREGDFDLSSDNRRRRLQKVQNMAAADILALKARLKNPRPAAPPKEREIMWKDPADSLQLDGKASTRFTLVCPSYPSGVRADGLFVFGTGPFSGSSGVCVSALYAGLITSSGGTVTIETGPVLGSFNGSTSYENAPAFRKNGVQAFAWPHEAFVGFPAPRSSFQFVK